MDDVEFLSPEWFARFEAALAAAGDDGEPFALGQVITGAPGGEVRYTVVLGSGAPRVEVGSVESATVSLLEDYATARSIASGTPASQLLATGRVKVRGDVNALLSAQDRLAGIGAALSGLAASTSFPDDEEQR